MRPDWARDAAAVWDIACPSAPSRLPGVSVAGFRQRSPDLDLRLVPFPAVTLAFDFGDAPFVVDDAHGNQQRGSGVVGLAPEGLRVRGRDIECVQVRLSPIVAHAVLGAGSSEARGTMISLDDLWGRDAARINERLRVATSWDERFSIIDAALVRRYEDGERVDAEVAWAWTELMRSSGRLRIDELATSVGWSRKRLWSRFGAQLGLSPKRAAQLVRFDAAAHRLAAGDRAAVVAAEAGFADQSHLHRDVVAFTGVTPTDVAVAPWLAVDDLAWAGSGHAPKV